MLAGLVQLAMEVIIGPRIAAAARIGNTAAIARTARRMVGLVLVLAAPLFLVIFIAPEFLLGIPVRSSSAARWRCRLWAAGTWSGWRRGHSA